MLSAGGSRSAIHVNGLQGAVLVAALALGVPHGAAVLLAASVAAGLSARSAVSVQAVRAVRDVEGEPLVGHLRDEIERHSHQRPQKKQATRGRTKPEHE